jgi:PAS domain S-box-containing protein
MRQKLTAGLGLIGLLLLAVLVPALAAAWRDHEAARHTERTNDIIGDIVEALENLTRERSQVAAFLGRPEPLAEAWRAELDAWRKGGDGALDDALRALAADPAIDIPAVRSSVEERRQRIAALRREVDGAVALPLAARDATLGARWLAASSDVVNALKTLMVALCADARGRGGTFAALASLRLAAFDLRDVAGIEAAILTTAVLSGQAPSTAERATLTTLRAQIASAWTMIAGLEPVLGYSGINDVIQRARDGFTNRFAPLRDAVYRAVDGQSADPVTARAFETETAALLDGAVNIVEAAQRAGARLAMDQQDAARRSLVLYAGSALLLFALFAGIAGTALAGVVRPAEQIAAAMRRIAAGERDPAIPAAGHGDEIDDMIAALHDYRRAIETREARSQGILDNLADIVVTIDEQGRIESFNLAAEAVLGYSAAEVIGRNISTLMAEPDRSRHDEHLRRYLETGASRVLGKGGREVTALRKNGVPVLVELTVGEVKLGDRRIFVGTMRDITQRKRIEDELRRSEQQLRLINNALPVVIAYIDADLRFQYVNDRFGEWRRMPAAEAIGRPVRDVISDIAFSLARPHLEAALLGEARSYDAEILFPDGKCRAIHVHYVPHVGPAGRVLGIFALIEDVTERRRAEEALRESRRRLADAQRIAQLGNWEWNVLSNELWWSDEIYRIFGVTPGEFAPTYAAFLGLIHPDDRAFVESEVAAALHRERSYSIDHRIVRPDGEIRYLHEEGEVAFDEAGRPLRMTGAVQDVTDRRAMEEQLKQAQKMEAVGQLTGGIAHDFNNLLGVIVGNLDLLALRLADLPEERELLERAVGAVERGSSLTHRLLAFSRRQELRPQLTDINALVVDMSELLKRTLGESVEVRTLVGEGVWRSLVDPAQMESAVLNLAINARDAMPEGGCLTIATAGETFDEKSATAGLAPGDYVAIAVTDSGHGMLPEVQARAFEPFFTTKQAGKGSGLGLSMVYGFVKQSGGHITIDSAVGRGTTVRIYLPRSEAVAEGAAGPGAGGPASEGPGRTVLVVEDNPAMRDFSRNALLELGYETVVAEDASSALGLLERRADIAILFTDVILGTGMSGVDLAREAKKHRPDLKVLFMSGFVEGDALSDQGVEPGVELLTKPFRAAELGKRLARLIAEREP